MSRDCIEPRPGRELELAFLVGGDATAEEAARTEAHLASCPACRSFADRLRESQGALAALADELADPEALARVRHALRRRIEEEAARSERRPAWALALAAALVLAIVAAAVWLRGGDPGAREWPPAGSEPVAVGSQPSVGEAPAEVPDLRAGRAPTAATSDEVPVEASPSNRPVPHPGSPDRAPEPEAPILRAAAEPADAQPATVIEPDIATEPMVIQVVSDDPDIVFYWLVEPEETRDETVPS